MSGGGSKTQPGQNQGPVQNYGGGFMQPGVMTVDPTPPALKPMQAMIAQMMMARMQGQGQRQQAPMPTYGNIHEQLYGQNPFAGRPQGMGSDPRVLAPPPGGPNTEIWRQFGGSDIRPWNLPVVPQPGAFPSYGDVVSGSRLIRSYQPYR